MSCDFIKAASQNTNSDIQHVYVDYVDDKTQEFLTRFFPKFQNSASEATSKLRVITSHADFAESVQNVETRFWYLYAFVSTTTNNLLHNIFGPYVTFEGNEMTQYLLVERALCHFFVQQSTQLDNKDMIKKIWPNMNTDIFLPQPHEISSQKVVFGEPVRVAINFGNLFKQTLPLLDEEWVKEAINNSNISQLLKLTNVEKIFNEKNTSTGLVAANFFTHILQPSAMKSILINLARHRGVNFTFTACAVLANRILLSLKFLKKNNNNSSQEYIKLAILLAYVISLLVSLKKIHTRYPPGSYYYNFRGSNNNHDLLVYTIAKQNNGRGALVTWWPIFPSIDVDSKCGILPATGQPDNIKIKLIETLTPNKYLSNSTRPQKTILKRLNNTNNELNRNNKRVQFSDITLVKYFEKD